jgi:hypothetical protein
MATLFKGDNSTITLVEEDQGWAKPPSSYAGGKYFQNNDGSFDETRGTIESEARTPNAQLDSVRLGNKNVAGSFPVEIDPENYTALLESALYGEATLSGTDVTLTAASVSATKKFELVVPMLSGDQTTAGIAAGTIFNLTVQAPLENLSDIAVVVSATATDVTFYCPAQKEATLAATAVDLIVEPVNNIRPDRNLKSFNAEEILYSEDGATIARFMTAGAVVSGVSFDLPSDASAKATFSMLASGKYASQEYTQFDPALTDSADAHTAVVPHVKYDPLVLQDGELISEGTNTRCIWMSGTVGIENGTETHFVGCDFDAIGTVSGKLRITLDYEALFQSEDDFVTFKNEMYNKVLLKLKDRASNKSLILYLPAFKATAYTLNNPNSGLVTASISGMATVDQLVGDSIVIGVLDG